MKFDVSVVCSTYGRAHKLPGLIGALEAQTFDRDRFEVVVVNDGSPDETGDVLARLAAASPLHIRVVSLEKNRGRSGGRNAGWREAEAPIIAFTDDDCLPTPEWLTAGLQAAKTSGASVVVGRTSPNPAHDANRGAFSRTQSVGEKDGTKFMHTCNIFYRRADLDAVGGLDEKFNTKGGEDTELGWRVLDRGGTVVFAHDALVLHEISRGSFGAAVREAAMWQDIPRVTKLHPKRARPLLVHRLFWKKSHELVLLAVAGIVVAAVLRNPVPLVAIGPWAYYRVRKSPIVRTTKLARFTYLPHAFVIDVIEVVTMVRGSIRNRVLVL